MAVSIILDKIAFAIEQASPSGNDSFEILLSTPMIRHFDEEFLKKVIPIYEMIEENPNAFSSMWLKRTR